MQGKEPRKMSNLLVTDGVDDSVLELWNSAAKTASRAGAMRLAAGRGFAIDIWLEP